MHSEYLNVRQIACPAASAQPIASNYSLKRKKNKILEIKLEIFHRGIDAAIDIKG